MKKISLFLFTSLIIAAFSGCKKDDSHPSSTLVMSLTDDPAAYDEVNVEVIEIEVHTDADGWTTVPVTDSIYNLLSLQGNHAAFLANAVLPSGTISQVRLILGTHNSVVI